MQIKTIGMKSTNLLDFSLPFHPFIYVLITTLISCSSQTDEQTKQYSSDSFVQETMTTTSSTPEERLLKLEIKRIFWKNRLHMARDESLDLVLDLEDSVLTLEIKGVPLRDCKIKKFFYSQKLADLRKNSSVIPWLSQPFFLMEDWSNIPKEPVKMRQIGSDDSTTENILDFYKEDIQEVEVVLLFNNGLSLYMGQNADEIFQDSSITNPGERNISIEEAYWVRINLPAPDAKAIYRSLSNKSELSFRY
jgi:hypothetical protein